MPTILLLLLLLLLPLLLHSTTTTITVTTILPLKPVLIVIVIVNSKLLKRHLKAKRRAPAYSRALRQIRGVFQRIVRGRLRSVFQRVRECVKSEVFFKE